MQMQLLIATIFVAVMAANAYLCTLFAQSFDLSATSPVVLALVAIVAILYLSFVAYLVSVPLRHQWKIYAGQTQYICTTPTLSSGAVMTHDGYEELSSDTVSCGDGDNY